MTRPCRRGTRGHDARYSVIGMPGGDGVDVCPQHLAGAVNDLLAAGAEHVTVTPIPGQR